jgi:hypothetical protein
MRREGRHSSYGGFIRDVITSVKRRLESSDFLLSSLPHESTPIPLSEFHVSLLSALSCGRVLPLGALLDSVTGGTICITASTAARLNTVLAGLALKLTGESLPGCHVQAAAAAGPVCAPNVVPSRHIA